MLVNWMGESFHNVYVYQITTMYTLNVLQFYMSTRGMVHTFIPVLSLASLLPSGWGGANRGQR